MSPFSLVINFSLSKNQYLVFFSDEPVFGASAARASTSLTLCFFPQPQIDKIRMMLFQTQNSNKWLMFRNTLTCYICCRGYHSSKSIQNLWLFQLFFFFPAITECIDICAQTLVFIITLTLSINSLWRKISIWINVTVSQAGWWGSVL